MRIHLGFVCETGRFMVECFHFKDFGEVPATEKWDAYDANFKKIPGLSLLRGEAIPESKYHLVCDVIVRHTDGNYLLMQRDPRKPYGGMWEATAGGSAIQGESPLECAIRELWEETGIAANDLIEVGRVKSHNTFYVEFLCVTAGEKDNIRLQEGETVAFRWVSRDELLSMKKSELLTERMQNFIADLQP